MIHAPTAHISLVTSGIGRVGSPPLTSPPPRTRPLLRENGPGLPATKGMTPHRRVRGPDRPDYSLAWITHQALRPRSAQVGHPLFEKRHPEARRPCSMSGERNLEVTLVSQSPPGTPNQPGASGFNFFVRRDDLWAISKNLILLAQCVQY